MHRCLRTSHLLLVALALLLDARPGWADPPVVLRHTPVEEAERHRELVLRAVIVAPEGAYLPTLYYRPGGGDRFYSLPMLPVPGSVNIYAGAIPGIFVTGDLDYYLESFDTRLRGPAQAGSQRQPLSVRVIDPAVQPSLVAVRSDPPDAILEIDGVEAGITPWRGPLPPGQHELLLRKEGFLEAASAFAVSPGRDLDLRLSLTPSTEAAQFAVMSEPSGATVSIGGQPLGATPLIAPTPEGVHVLTVEKQGYARAERTVAFSRDRSVEITFTLQKLPPEPALAVTTDPPGALVTVDDQELGRTPFIGVVPPGEHVLLLTLEGHRTAQAQILMPEDRDLDLRFTLEEAREPRPPALAISSDPPGASVLLDGTELGETPYIDQLPPGEYRLRLEHPGYLPYERTVLMPEANDLEVTLALLPERVASGPSEVTISSMPRGVEVAIDGEAVGVAPLSLELVPGTHVAAARKEGFRSVEEHFTVKPGQALQMKLALQPLPPEAAEEPLLTVRSEPDGALVTIDGEQVGTTPYSAALAPGAHRLVVSLEGYRPREETFELPADKAFELRYAIPLEPLRRTVSLASAADQKRAADARHLGPLVDLDSVRSAAMSGQKYKVYKPGELQKLREEAERRRKDRAAQAAAARAPLPEEVLRTSFQATPAGGVFRPGPLVLALLGAVSTGTGAYFGLQAQSTAARMADPRAPDRTTLYERHQRETSVSLALAGVGLGMAAVGAIWGALPSSPPAAPAGTEAAPSPVVAQAPSGN